MPRRKASSAFSDADLSFMRAALRRALCGRGWVEPNPMVGCVIVRDGRMLSRACHKRYGGPHAEVEALNSCRAPARGATVYVTLEPCCYEGKTPACTDALRKARVRRVVVGTEDPNPRVNGRGIAVLRKAGITVDVGARRDEAARLIQPFSKLVTQGRPWVILKWGQSLDGKLATRTGDAKWITDERQRRHAHEIRGRLDAILTGVGTVLADDPLLTCRVGTRRRVATRVVLDSSLRTPPSAQLVATARQTPTWFFCSTAAPARRAEALEAAGCRVTRVAAGRNGGLSLPAVLDELGRERMTNVLVEGGGNLLGSFFDEKLADEVQIYVAPTLIGGKDAVGALHGVGAERVAAALRLSADAMRRCGDGWFIAGRISEPK